jgi:flagellar biosynthesis anti-sigma factor FlgM
MKIELAGLAANQPAIEQSTRQASNSSSVAGSTTAEDRTTLSSDCSTVQLLVEQALQMPAVRQDVVAAVQQQIRSGVYKVNVGRIADGIIRESNV